MDPHPDGRTRPLLPWRFALPILALIALAAILGSNHGPAPAVAAKGMVMTDESMRRLSERWFAAHPAHGAAVNAVAADTVRAGNFHFDTDNNLATSVDTAFITTDQTILFKWVLGGHTATDGDLSEPNPGLQWSAPVDGAHPEYSHTFLTAGTFGFQCIFHAAFSNMVGYVVVTDPAGVPTDGGAKNGFLSAPWPNPTRLGFSVRFALAHPGRAHVAAYDAAGRAVATLFDREVDAGTFDATWDGRGTGGGRVAPGVYYVRLTGPGLSQSRRVTIGR